MANDFSGDANCKALWCFESGAITADSKGSNTLDTSASPPTLDFVTFQEGAASASFAAASSQLFKVDDANLDAGFPLKDGDSAKLFSAALWWTPTSNSGIEYRSLLAKYCNGYYKSINIAHYGTRLKIQLGYGTGTTSTTLDTGIDFVNGETYHVGVTLDGTTGALNVRVYRVSNDTVYTYSITTGTALYVGPASFAIGSKSDYTASTFIDGNLDEVVIFNKILTNNEIDKIRMGTAGGPDIYACVASGVIEVTGSSVIDDPGAVTTDFAAYGSAYIGDKKYGVPVASFQNILPSENDFVASGSLNVGIKRAAVSFNPPPGPMDLVATGAIVIVGGCDVDTDIDLPVTKDFSAAGYISARGRHSQVTFLAPGESPARSLVLSLVADGYINVGGRPVARVDFDSQASVLISAFAAYGAMVVCGEGQIDFPSLLTSAYAAHVGLGATCIQIMTGDVRVGFINPLVVEMAAAGAVVFEAPEPQEDGTFETLVLTGYRNEPSIYSNFNFNSYARYKGQYFGAGRDGIYLLEGEDDAGEEIHPGVRIGPHNYGIDREKRLRSVRLAGRADNARVKIAAGEDEGYFDSDRGRVKVSRNLQDREFTLDISDFEQLSQIEIVPLVLAKR